VSEVDGATCGFLADWHRTTPVTRCGEPAIAVVTAGCVHEHLETQPACAGCAAEIQRAADRLACFICEGGPEPHECRAILQIRWLEGAQP
jgi:hypothetical protein